MAEGLPDDASPRDALNAPVMDERQRAIYAWLQHAAPRLAESYATMLGLLGGPEFPGRTNLVCHIGRDVLGNVLKAWTGGKGQRNASGEYHKRTKAMLQAMPCLRHAAESPTALVESGPMSPTARDAIKRFLDTHDSVVAERAGMERLAERLYADFGGVNPALVKELAEALKDLRKWFADRAHMGTTEAKHTSNTQLREKVEDMAAILWPLVVRRRDVLDQLRPMLDKANATPYPTPTNEEVAYVAGLLNAPDFERVIFESLENPEWIEPLRVRGVFESPAFERCAYLSRMALHGPELVVGIFRAWHSPDGETVRHIIIAALAMPPEHAASLVEYLTKECVSLGFVQRVPRLGKLIAMLARAGRADEASRLLEGPYRPDLDPNVKRLAGGALQIYLRSLQTDVIPSLSASAPEKLITHLCGVIDRQSEESRAGYKTTPHATCFEQQLINAPVAQLGRDTLKDLSFLILLAIDRIIDDGSMTLDDVLALFSQHDGVRWHRFRLAVLARRKDPPQELVQDAIMDADVLDYRVLLFDLGNLLALQFHNLSPDAQDEWFERVMQGPGRLPESVGATDEAADFRDGWIAERLSFVAHWLDGARLARFQELRAKYEGPLPPKPWKAEARFVGVKSPFSVDDLRNMEPAAMIQAVASWRPEPNADPIESPSHEGLREAFVAAINADAVAWSERAALLREAPTWMLDRYLSGLLTSNDSALAWNAGPLLDLYATFPSRAVAEFDIHPRSHPDIVPPWASACQTAADLLRFLMMSSDESGRPLLPLDHRAELWRAIDGLFVLVALDDEPRTGSHGDLPRIGYRQFRHSNAAYKAMRAVLTFIEWALRHNQLNFEEPRGPAQGLDLVPEARQRIQLALQPDGRTIGGHMMLGERIGLLVWLDRDWVKAHASQLFPIVRQSDGGVVPAGWAAWCAYTRLGRGFADAWDLFEAQYRQAITVAESAEAPEDEDEDPLLAMGMHLVDMHALGIDMLGKRQPLRKLLWAAKPWLRIGIMSKLSERLLYSQEPPSSDVMARVEELWSYYWKEFGKADASETGAGYLFGQWFVSDRSSPSWSLERLKEVVAAGVFPQPDYLVVKRLTKLATEHPATVATILLGMINNAAHTYDVYGWGEHVPVILAAARASGGEAAAIADTIEDRLLKLGIDGKH